MDQWECIGTVKAPHQSWTLDLLDDDEPMAGTITARLRNFAYNTKCLRAMSRGNGAELEIVDCSDSSVDQLIKMESFKVCEPRRYSVSTLDSTVLHFSKWQTLLAIYNLTIVQSALV